MIHRLNRSKVLTFPSLLHEIKNNKLYPNIKKSKKYKYIIFPDIKLIITLILIFLDNFFNLTFAIKLLNNHNS